MQLVSSVCVCRKKKYIHKSNQVHTQYNVMHYIRSKIISTAHCYIFHFRFSWRASHWTTNIPAISMPIAYKLILWNRRCARPPPSSSPAAAAVQTRYPSCSIHSAHFTSALRLSLAPLPYLFRMHTCTPASPTVPPAITYESSSLTRTLSYTRSVARSLPLLLLTLVHPHPLHAWNVHGPKQLT